MAGFTGGIVPGVADFALKTSDANSYAQMSDNKPLNIPSGKTKEEVDAKYEEWVRINKERAFEYDKYVKRGKENKDNFTKCSGNECKTQASLYGHQFDRKETKSGAIHDKYGFTAAMQPIHVGKIPHKKDAGNYVYARVENIENGKTVIVKIDDKGPFPVEGKNVNEWHEDPTRGIDLSPAAYAEITHKMGAGTLNVKVTFLPPKDGQRDYEQQNKDAVKRRPEIKQKVHEALMANDPAYVKKFKKEHNLK
jgi:rare lipoprotein A